MSNVSLKEPFDWHQYAGNASSEQFDWRQYAGNASGGQEFNRQHFDLPGNFSGDASDATTEDELKVWRERARNQINRYVPKSFQNESLAAVDVEYEQNLDRIRTPTAVATEAPEADVSGVVTDAVTAAPAVVTDAPAVAPTEAPAAVAVTEAPAVATTVATTASCWFCFGTEAPLPAVAPVTPMQMLAESPLRQASPMLLMLALLAGVAVFAVAVGQRHRHVGAASEPLLPTEHAVLP